MIPLAQAVKMAYHQIRQAWLHDTHENQSPLALVLYPERDQTQIRVCHAATWRAKNQRAFVLSSVRARVGKANGPCRGRTQTPMALMTPAPRTCLRYRIKPAEQNHAVMHSDWPTIRALDRLNEALMAAVAFEGGRELHSGMHSGSPYL